MRRAKTSDEKFDHRDCMGLHGLVENALPLDRAFIVIKEINRLYETAPGSIQQSALY